MNVVVIGHVDHGKSTVIGRLLADTGSLPEGKLEQVRENCRINSKPFEYAFLLDALKDEQSQGITIDSARCFFSSRKRDYIIIDAPGHVEFVKNMVTGAARAQAGLLVIDAKEGVQENSRRHGYLLSMLGINSIAVCVNKMDLVDYDQAVYESIVTEYREFLEKINLHPRVFVPASARDGEGITSFSENMSWYKGPDVLEVFDSFEQPAKKIDKPLRFPVQDIYRFTKEGDDRRIVAGRIETGEVKTGEDVMFLPSGKKSRIASVEAFNVSDKPTRAYTGQSTGFTLENQIYIRPGEVMVKESDPPCRTGTRFKANIFWLGRHPMIKDKRYKIKLAGARESVWLREVNTVLDASSLSASDKREQIERLDVAECVLETIKPLAFDIATEIAETGRFVIIDNYEISGGGIVLENEPEGKDRLTEHVEHRDNAWQRSDIAKDRRTARYNQRSALVLITGPADAGKSKLAKQLEASLFDSGRMVYYLGIANTMLGIDSDLNAGSKDEHIRRLGEISHLFNDAGLILIATASDIDDYEVNAIKKLNSPNDCVVVTIGEHRLNTEKSDLHVPDASKHNEVINTIREYLTEHKYLIEYYL
ncbi:GTP-binding protein [Anaerohalosphaera lusitana]|nr:GTP-binding protein [Anaerohalosphaera lusitana]